MTNNIIETEFQRNNTTAYQLSILIGMDSLVYSVYDDVSNRLLALKVLPFPKENGTLSSLATKLEETINKEDLLTPLYRRVKIVFISADTSLVPTRLYNEQEKSTYLEELSSKRNNDAVLVDEIGPLKIKTVYSLDREALITLKAKFPTAHFFSAATPFLVGSHHSLSERNEESAFACFQKNIFQLAIFNQNELLFYNCFNFNSTSDVLYFVLLAFEQYGLDTESTPLFLSGNIVLDSDIYKTLYRYVSDLKFLPAPSFIQLGKSASSFDPNFYFPLHSLLLCK